jgi:hypothetical protein
MGQYKYVVYVDDNFHYMDENERYKLGEFDNCAAATAACRKIVDDFLQQSRRESQNLIETYVMFGEDPFIVSDDPDCKFSARDYARERVRAMKEDGPN